MLKLQEHFIGRAIVFTAVCLASGAVTAQNWVNEASMKLARVEATTVDYRDDIYVFNGFKAGLQVANSVEKFDAGTRKWTTVSSTTTMNGSAVTHNGVVRVGADVWIIGGRIGRHPGRVSNKVWIYNLDKGKWRGGPNLPIAGAAGGAALVNNKIHWFGGLDVNASCDVARHFVYDLGKPATGWKNITANAAMPSPRNHFSTAVVNGVIYAMGGQYGHDACPGKNTTDTPLVHAFNPKTNKWSRKADLPNKNSHSEPGTFVYKGDIYTTGGENAKNKVWKYNPRSNKWSTFKILSDELVAPIARIIDGRLIVAGGGAPIAQKPTTRVRSLLVDNNPPKTEPNTVTTHEPEPAPKPEPAPEPEPLPGSGIPAGPTLISMEAEYFDVKESTSTHQWVRTVLGDSSNDDAMTTTPDEGQLAGSIGKTPMLSYMVYFNHPGKHYIWVRGLGDTNGSGVGNSDSIHVGINGKIADSAYRIDQFPNQWTWSRHTPSNSVASLNVVNAGVNMLNVWMREDGLAIDKFVITSDPDFIPSGFGPDVTDGTDSYEPPIDSATDNESEVDEDNDNDSAEESDNNVMDSAADESASVESDALEHDSVETMAPELNDEQATEEMTADNGLKEPAVTISENDSRTLNDQTPTDSAVLDDGGSEPVSEPETHAIASSGSSGGLFGGGASLLTLLGLLCVCFARAGLQQRNERQASVN